MIFIVILCLSTRFQATQHAVCTRNPKYARASKGSTEVYLCKSVDCAKPVRYLENGATYYGCKNRYFEKKELSGRYNVALRLLKRTLSGYDSIACFNNQWNAITSNRACDVMNKFKFIPFNTVSNYHLYFVSCNGKEDEFPNADLPRIQIFGFDFEFDRKLAKPPVLFPAQKIKCYSNCLELEPKFTNIHKSTYISIDKNILTIKIGNIKPNINISEIEVSCGGGLGSIQKLYFDIANNITARVVGEGRVRSLNIYDAGEVISCLVNGRSTTTLKNGATPSTYITIVTGQLSTFDQFITPKDRSEVEIPEGLFPNKTYQIFCYLGNMTEGISYQVLLQIMKFGARFKTRLSRMSSPFHIVPGTRILCDHDHYRRLIIKIYNTYDMVLTQIFIIYVDYLFPPYSHLTDHKEIKWENKTVGYIDFYTKFKSNFIYVFCGVNEFVTTPTRIYPQDRPKVMMEYWHPKWKTDYQLRGFIIQCVGEYVNSIDLMCMDCLPDSRITSTKVSVNTIQLRVPEDIKKEVKVNFKCTGYSDRYRPDSIIIPLHIIVSESTDIDKKLVFFQYGVDFIKCVSQFTVNYGNASVKKEIRMPVLLQVNEEPILNQYGINNSILLKAAIETTKVYNFRACCPEFGAGNQYFCKTKWTPIKVAESYTINYNVPLTNIYPGNLLKCYICVNYTHELIHSTECNDKHKIPSLISMHVTYPDGKEINTVEQTEVLVPVEELKPNKEGYYKITDYIVKIGCKVNSLTSLVEIKMKSCNMNPPDIFISPPEKIMFLVGDIFSCSTKSINCKNGLTYTIYVQKGTGVAEKKESHSFTLSRRHIGNNIIIKCVAGEAEGSEDRRFIRVETGPYNVSILNVFPILVYGNYLICHALGFPPPSITWTQLKGRSSLRISESYLLIGPWDYSDDYMIQCEAKNKRGSVTTFTSFKIFNKNIIFEEYNLMFHFGIPMMTLGYLILLFLSLFFIFQEDVFGIPFFSEGSIDKVEAPQPRTTVISTPKPTIKKISTQESALSSH